MYATARSGFDQDERFKMIEAHVAGLQLDARVKDRILREKGDTDDRVSELAKMMFEQDIAANQYNNEENRAWTQDELSEKYRRFWANAFAMHSMRQDPGRRFGGGN